MNDKATVYEKIEAVLEKAGRPLAEFEFADVMIHVPVPGDGEPLNGRYYIGCSESSLARRLRELRELGRVASRRREGQAYMEYTLVRKIAAVPA